jgi:hypothetical protein
MGLRERLSFAAEIGMRAKARFANGAPNINIEGGEALSASIEKAAHTKVNQWITEKQFPVKPHYEAWYQSDEKYVNVRCPIKWALANMIAVKKEAKQAKAGDCGPQSRRVFLRCYKQGMFPVDIVEFLHVKGYQSHETVVIGLPDLKDPRNRTKEDLLQMLEQQMLGVQSKPWYEDDLTAYADTEAVVCDPWMMLLLEKKFSTFSNGAYTVKLYMKLTKEVMNDYVMYRCNRMTSPNGGTFVNV